MDRPPRERRRAETRACGSLQACWRGALGWSAAKHAAFWEPVTPRIKEIEGLGSYSSYLGDLTDPKFKRMGCA